MSSTSSRPIGEGAPAPPVFSYAQAAKGRPTSTVASTIQSSQTNTSGVSTPAKDSTSAVNTPSGGSERGDRSVNGSYEVASKVDTPRDGLISDPKAAAATKPRSSPASPSFGIASTPTLPKEDKEDDFVLVGSTPSDSIRDRSSQGGAFAIEKTAEATDGRKGKKSKKQKNTEKEAEKEKEKEEVKPEVLVPAPLPTVNFWQQRKEELAKTKPSPVLVQSSQSFVETSTSNDAILTTPKPGDAKKRGKSSNTDDGDRAIGAKDTSNTGRGQRKGGEGAGKAKEDQPNKRAGPRGSRTGDRDEKSLPNQLPPPVEDAISWPTPETALEEEKRKAQEKLEKEEKDDNASSKPRPKEKWVPVPYIPTVTFNTPFPTRGGRGRGGARGGRTEGAGRPSHTNGSAAGEKGQNASTTAIGNPSTEPERRPSRDGPRAASLPPNSKRSNENATRDQRKTSTAQPADKSRNGPIKSESSPPVDARYPSGAGASGQDRAFENIQDQRGEILAGFTPDHMQSNNNESQSLAGNNDRKSDSSLRGSDPFKETTMFNRDSNPQSRERNDVRSDRGRGGFRGRGGHNNYPNGQPHPQHVFTNGHPSQPLNGYPIRQSSGPYSPPLQPPPFSNQYVPSPARGGRGGSRSQSIPNNSMYGRFPPNGGPLPQHMGPLQTSNPMFDYPPQQPMSAVSYTSYIDYPSLIAMVTMQIEYYFSIDNLCKDVYLRKHMDTQGFVFLNFIAGFKRIQSLTQEFETLRFACQESEIIDFVRGDDGFDRLRRKEGWEKWVLSMEERDESVRNAGPAYVQRQQLVQRPQHMGGMIMPSHHSMSPPAFSPNGTESSFRPFGNGAPVPPLLNGNGTSYHPETPLSAAVPDFAPGLLALNGTPDPLEAEVTFHDDEVAHLTVVFTPQRGPDDSKSKTSFHNASSRTFSNGSIDGRSIAEELHDNPRQGRTLTNGSRATEASPDNLRRSRSPFAPLSPTKSTTSNGPPVMWVKGQRQPAPVSEHNSEELYTSFYSRALRNRESSNIGETHPDMKLLYEFWSHFLCRNFNLTMYFEFRRYAFEDARENAMTGMKNLISYYDEILNSKKKVIPETLARHYVELVKTEEPGDRPAFEKLRAAWRNGALDMKSRKKIDNLVDSNLREELERAPHQKSDLS